MIMVLFIAVALFFAGKAFGVSLRARIMVLCALFSLVVFFQLTLPEGNPIKDATGGSALNWFILAGVAAIGVAYRTLLLRLRARHDDKHVPQQVQSGTFKPEELDRYARHITLREIGGAGQRKLKSAKVLVIGAGGLGAPALQYLAAAGVGTIGVVDDDVVEASNLQRQVIHTDARIGMAKVFSATQALNAQNPFVEIRPYQRRLTADIAPELIADYDLVLDGTDNFETRYLVNRVCATVGRPLISAAITQWEGQIGLYNSEGGPCYRCVFPQAPDPANTQTCAEAGVMGALPGVLGAMMAVEAIKQITGAGDGLNGRLMIYDALYAETRVITVKKQLDCPICSGNT